MSINKRWPPLLGLCLLSDSVSDILKLLLSQYAIPHWNINFEGKDLSILFTTLFSAPRIIVGTEQALN